jgi:glycosyltransferase involved in cell wall biosynthesis
MRIAMIGDGESPHLLKWAGALARVDDVELFVASSRRFDPGFDAVVPAARRLALETTPRRSGGNARLLVQLPRLGVWLRRIDADWLNPHYLTSHATLAWLARRMFGLRARIVASAWGSDVLVAPQRSVVLRRVTVAVLRAATVATSDSEHMAARMGALGAREVMTFPFGLERLPPPATDKDRWLFFANRALEPLYRPERVLRTFAAIAAAVPSARLVVANVGSLATVLHRQAQALGLRVAPLEAGGQVAFVGRLDAAVQDRWYARSQWYLSLPASDSVAVSVLEAMAHGCIPLLSDLPANRELVRDGDNGIVVPETGLDPARLNALAARAPLVMQRNRMWIEAHALIGPAIGQLVARLRALGPA